MRQPKMSDLVIDRKGTKRLRAEVAKTKKVKITINIDQDSLNALRKMAGTTGAPYQRLLNQILKKGLRKRGQSDSRLDRIERELAKLKKKAAA
jgi:predicted DNA binding CopG/RHH family protein